MSVENGEWIMRGVETDDPSCLHNVEEMERLVDETGFLPLFAGDVEGFSVEEHTDPSAWWTENKETDPWEWRETAARRHNVVYGKFFNGRAGFISKKWLPVFANYRRDGYDFDARWDDELASWRQKKIMDLFLKDQGEQELLSSEVKEQAGFGKNGEKNFEGTLTGLEMETYLIVSDFRQRKNKKGEAYGWSIAVLATPEHVFGRELVTSEYDTDPKESLRQIVNRVKEFCPSASDAAILRLVGYSEDRPSARNAAALPYPQNLLKALDKGKDPESWTQDQISGLYVAIGQLRPKHQRVLRGKFEENKSNEELGLEMNRSAGTISSYRRVAMNRLRNNPLISAWYRDGYSVNLRACAAGEHWSFPLPETADEISENDLCLRIGLKVMIFEHLAASGILTIRDLLDAMNSSHTWYRDIYGVGAKTAEDMQRKLEKFFPKTGKEADISEVIF